LYNALDKNYDAKWPSDQQQKEDFLDYYYGRTLTLDETLHEGITDSLGTIHEALFNIRHNFWPDRNGILNLAARLLQCFQEQPATRLQAHDPQIMDSLADGGSCLCAMS